MQPAPGPGGRQRFYGWRILENKREAVGQRKKELIEHGILVFASYLIRHFHLHQGLSPLGPQTSGLVHSLRGHPGHCGGRRASLTPPPPWQEHPRL